MANRIGLTHKLGKQIRKQTENITNTSNYPSTHSNRNVKLNENIDITSTQ